MRFCRLCDQKTNKQNSWNVQIIRHWDMLEIISDRPLDWSDPAVTDMIFSVMMQWPSKRTSPYSENFFDQKDIVDFPVDDKSVFISHLHYSSWSSYFVHGADMMPWLSEGLSWFLEQRHTSLNSIDKIRFKKKVTGDIKYTISSEEDKSMLEYASVEWKCTDDKGVQYVFYGMQVWDDRNFITTRNHIPVSLISRKSRMSLDKNHSWNTMHINIDETIYDKWYYIDSMTKNPGYVWSVVLDIINIMYQAKFDWSWLVISYENLLIDKNFDPHHLFDKSCRIETSIVGECKKIKGGEWYKCEFSLIHPQKWKLLSWKVTLFTK